MTHYNILILGASYGSLLATKLLLAGHDVRMICLPAEAELFNAEGAIIRTPVKGVEGLVEIRSAGLSGKLSASGPQSVDPGQYDLVVLAMQEPQYSAAGVRELLARVGRARVPCMSIMNMPPLPYLRRIPGLNVDALGSCYTEPAVWADFDPATMTLCSPDPQAFRPPEEKPNVLQVRLPTNFKSAAFEGGEATAMLRNLEADIENVRFDTGLGKPVELPVKLRVHDSVFVPLAKWAMLVAGNYRCVQADGIRPIKEAVHSDVDATRAVYNWVVDLCIGLGGSAGDFVPFEKYANAAQSLGSPSSAARALAAGAQRIERVDKLVQAIGKLNGKHNAAVDATVQLVDAWLEKNRAAAKKS